MKEIELFRKGTEKVSKGILRAATYVQEVHQFLSNLNEPGQHRDSLKRAVLYPILSASAGVIGTWVMWEATYAMTYLTMSGINYIINKEPIPADLASYLNNPFRNMYFPEAPLFVGKAMAMFGAVKALTEEYRGIPPDYRAFFHGRPI